MLKQRLITVLILGPACWLVLSGAALAKGPTGLTIDAPGPGEPIEIRGVSESCRSGICTELLEAVGFFQLMFDVKRQRNQVTPAINRRPKGPVYVLTWDMGVDIPMDVYPNADGGPLAYLAPGLYEEDGHSQSLDVAGGWFRADTALLDLLAAYGVHFDETAIPVGPTDCPILRLPSGLWLASHWSARPDPCGRMDPGLPSEKGSVLQPVQSPSRDHSSDRNPVHRVWTLPVSAHSCNGDVGVGVLRGRNPTEESTIVAEKSNGREGRHLVSEPRVLYLGTPVVLVTTSNGDGTANLAPISSAWWIDRSCMLGLDMTSRTTLNLQDRKELVLNMPDATLVDCVDRIARYTGSRIVPPHKAAKGYTHLADKFGEAGLTPVPADLVDPPRVAECPIQMEAKVERIHPIGERGAGLVAVEAGILRTHVRHDMFIEGSTRHIDPERWDPLLMKFTHYYGHARNLHPSRLAEAWDVPAVPADRK